MKNRNIRTGSRQMKLFVAFLSLFLIFSWVTLSFAEKSRNAVLEPQYMGKRLSQWLEEFRNSIPAPEYDGDERMHGAAKDAIQKIGTNALPWLLVELSAKEPTTNDDLPKNFTSGEAIKKRWRAAPAFAVLGSEAKAATPKLVELLDDKQTAYTAAVALGGLGLDIIPVLKQALTNEHPCARESAARVLGLNFGKNASVALSDLKRCAQDKDASVRSSATFALGQVAAEAEEVLPILLKNLNDSNESVRKNAEYALKRVDPTGTKRKDSEKKN